jgi:hypothetical protein
MERALSSTMKNFVVFLHHHGLAPDIINCKMRPGGIRVSMEDNPFSSSNLEENRVLLHERQIQGMINIQTIMDVLPLKMKENALHCWPTCWPPPTGPPLLPALRVMCAVAAWHRRSWAGAG